MSSFAAELVAFIRDLYRTEELVPLHAPVFSGNEKRYLSEAIDSTMVSTVGEFVVDFEKQIAQITGAKYAVAVCNGTAALHLALLAAGVKLNDEVITQSITFVATCNAISYCGAHPVFVDVERESLGLSPESLQYFLENYADLDDSGVCRSRWSGRVIRACVPVHNLGHPSRVDKIKAICDQYQIALVEDSAEALGSYLNGRHVGTFGQAGVISFNGNKIITTGGGGVVLTNSEDVAVKVRHISTTAKMPHSYLYIHDQLGFNYRMPNLNAALGLGQIEQLNHHLGSKRIVAGRYSAWFDLHDREFFAEASWASSNYWLNAFFTASAAERDEVLDYSNSAQVMTRPMWTPMHTQLPYRDCLRIALPVTERIEETLVCLPSSPPAEDHG